MTGTVTSFKKAKEEKSIEKQDGNIICKAKTENLMHALSFLKDAFGYSSMPEHYHAEYTRLNRDIFEGTKSLMVCGLITGSGNLILQRMEDDDQPVPSIMGANEFWITTLTDNSLKGCEVHSLSYTGSTPYLVMREEMKTVHPKIHKAIMWNVERLQAIKPLWHELRNNPKIEILRPKP